ncbi:hypothetical protein [Roseateles sp. BYS96W]|uniref:Uncharacterized protein n=1 Tax=Pelomonas nitida TaxID=3299027 RepID=A0ABW7G0W8_9BURK
MPNCYFDVETILTDGLIIGRNEYQDIPVGTVFTALRKSKLVGEMPNLQPFDLGELANVNLRLLEVQWYRRHLDFIPRGHTAGLRLSGDGISLLAEALAERGERESVKLQCSL